MLAGTSGIRSACNSVGKALWSKTTGGSLLDKGASVKVFIPSDVVLLAFAWPLFQVAPHTRQRVIPLRWIICRRKRMKVIHTFRPCQALLAYNVVFVYFFSCVTLYRDKSNTER